MFMDYDMIVFESEDARKRNPVDTERFDNSFKALEAVDIHIRRVMCTSVDDIDTDGEARDIVSEEGMGSLPICEYQRVSLSVGEYPSDQDLADFAASAKPEAQFLAQAIRFVNGRGFEAYCTIIDCMAVGYAIDPTLVETMECKVGVETGGTLSRGMTVRDGRHHFVWQHLPTIQIGKDADYGRFLKLIRDLVLA